MTYGNRLGIVDLNSGNVEYLEIGDQLRRYFLGGRGFSSYMMLKLIKPNTEPLSGDNPLIISPGLLTGVLGITTSRCSISGKSPESGYYGESNIGGHFPALMKKNGFDLLVIKNNSSSPVNIVISSGKIWITEAAEHWGKDTYQVQDDLKNIYGQGSHILCIGPAGENLVRFACIRSGLKSAAGRTGLGCLMGAKKIKAIIALPTKNKLNAAYPTEYKEYCKALWERLKEEPMVGRFIEFGTPWLYDLVNEGVKVGRTYNGLTNEFIANENISSKKIIDFSYRRSSCFSCPFACRHHYKIDTGKYAGTTGVGPEYGIMANFGPMLGIKTLEPILAANDLINKWGIDSSTTGNLIAWVMELYDRGIITSEDTEGMALEWADEDVLLQLIEQIVFRKGFGNILADGARNASEIIGRDSARYLSMVKNLPQSCATDVRFFNAFALGMATATRGADHLRSRAFYDPLEYPAEDLEKIYGTIVDPAPEGYIGKARVVHWWESYLCAFDALGICKLIGLTNLPFVFMFDELRKLTELATGISLTNDELFEIGERITNMERMFLVREGIRREDDNLPERFFKPLEWTNSAPKRVLVREIFEKMLDEYYQWHDWEVKTGIPLESKLDELHILDFFSKQDLGI